MVLGVCVLATVVLSGCSADREPPAPASSPSLAAEQTESAAPLVAWETERQVQTTRQQSVVVGCALYSSVGRCVAPQTQSQTVPGPIVTESSFVCAASVEEARVLVAADVTLTGSESAAGSC